MLWSFTVIMLQLFFTVMAVLLVNRLCMNLLIETLKKIREAKSHIEKIRSLLSDA